MEKRIFIAVVISIAFLGLWSLVIPKFFPELVKKPAPVAAKPAAAKPSAAASKATTPTAAPAVVHAAVPISGTTLKQSVVDTPEFTAVFSNRGAELVSFKLKQYTTSDKQPVELVKGREPNRTDFPFAIETKDENQFNTAFYVTGNGVAQTQGKLQVLRREKGDRVNLYDDVQFVGVEDNYFLTVVRPAKGGQAIIRRADFKVGKEIRKELYAGVNAAGDGTVSGQAYFGPKQTKILEAYGLDSTLQFGFFGFIGRILLDVLIWINKTTRNYGLAIIALTVLIKIVLYPLQHKSIVSMKKMQKVQPKVEAIKNRYKKSRTDSEQRQKMNMEIMKLHQQEGINPLGGCLPMVLQLPILWGFYGLLSRAIELRGAPFYGWIHDLSGKDPYYITPILMTITMFLQQQLTPTTGDPAQRRMFLIMPLVFGWIFKEFPSGLVLYWLVQNVLTIVQQLIMNKYWKDHPAELKTA